jgi:hypothetical protein
MLCMAVLTLSSAADAQQSALDYVFPQVDRGQFDELCTSTGIDREQRMVTELLYRDYATALSDLVDRLDRAAVTAGRQRLEEVFAGRIRLAEDAVKELRLNVLDCYREAAPSALDLFNNLVTGIEIQLRDEQRNAFPAALRNLRRQTFLHPRHVSGPASNYAGEGVDVLLLAEDATRPGNELTDIGSVDLEEVLYRYELMLDEALRTIGIAPNLANLGLREYQITKDPDTQLRHQRAMVDAWTSIYLVNREAVVAIATLATQASGAWAGELWLDRFNHASFGWMYIAKTPDRQIEWMRGQEFDDDTLERAELAYGVYLAERGALIQKAIDVITRGRLELGTMLSPRQPPTFAPGEAHGMFQELLRNSGAQTSLDSRVSGALEGLLDEETRREMRRAVRASR